MPEVNWEEPVTITLRRGIAAAAVQALGHANNLNDVAQQARREIKGALDNGPSHLSGDGERLEEISLWLAVPNPGDSPTTRTQRTLYAAFLRKLAKDPRLSPENSSGEEQRWKPKGWSLIHRAHAKREEVVVTARRTWIAVGAYNEEGGEYRGHVVSIDDHGLELDKEGNTRIRIEWPDVLDASLWSECKPQDEEER